MPPRKRLDVKRITAAVAKTKPDVVIRRKQVDMSRRGEDHRNDPPRWMLTARCGGIDCGFMTLDEARVLGQSVLAVDMISVYPDFQRQGVATKLYENAADLACENGHNLASVFRLPDAKSNEFWTKQIAKGRASIWSRGNEGSNTDRIVLNFCERDLSGVRKRRR